MKAIIMAGGEGSRLRPLTCSYPKPMAPIMNTPIMEHIINLLKKNGIFEIGVTVMYKKEDIKSYFGNGAEFGVDITYFDEDIPVGTAGSVKLAKDFLTEDFLVISGDAVCDFDLKKLIKYHQSKNAEATICLKKMEMPLEYGVVVCDKNGKIIRFLEKPTWSEVFSDTVNTGIYVLNPTVLDVCEEAECDFSKDIFPKMLKEGRALYGVEAEGYWCDIGDLNVYRHCHFDVFDGKTNACDITLNNGIYISPKAVIEEHAYIKSPCYIGDNVHIKKGAVIDGYTVLGEGTTVEEYASIKRSVTGRGVLIEKESEIRGAILNDFSVIKSGAEIYEQSVIGESSVIGEHAVIKPGVKIWPSKSIAEGETITEDVIWENTKQKKLFGERGMIGSVNADLCPEFACKVGVAFGSLKKGGKVGVSSDGQPASIMLKKAAAAGLMSAGVNVYDFGNQPLPITRAGIALYGLSGGIHASFDGIGYIEILNETGANFLRSEEKKFSGILSHENYIRISPSDIKETVDVFDYKLYYLREIINSVKDKNIGKKILCATTSYWGERLFSSAAEELNCKYKIINQEIDEKNSESVKRFSETVKRGGYDLGISIDNSMEKLTLFDDKGKMISRDLYRVLIALIIMKKYKGAKIVASVSAPGVIEELAEKYGAEVERSKESPLEVMGKLCGEGECPELKEQFIFNFDAVGAFIKILDYLNTEKILLSTLLNEIPMFFVVHKNIECKFSDKGNVIKKILNDTEDEAQTIDGVKIIKENGSVLVLPDMTKPICKIICESGKEEYANELSEIYSEAIKRITSGGQDEKSTS